MQIYIYRWNRCGRKGQRCRVLARGTMNSGLVEFEDDWRMVTSRNALAKTRDWPAWKSAKVVFQAPEDARYVCGDRGWWYYIRGDEIFAAKWPRNDSYMLPKDAKRGRAAAERSWREMTKS